MSEHLTDKRKVGTDNDYVETYAIHSDSPFKRNEPPVAIMHHTRVVPDPVAAYAMELVRHCGILLGAPEGEDSSGRARMAVMPAEAVAGRAFDIAEAMYAQMRSRGHAIELPGYQEIASGFDPKDG